MRNMFFLNRIFDMSLRRYFMYSVGVLKSKMYSISTAFEISKKGREVIKINAKLNNIEKNLEILEI